MQFTKECGIVLYGAGEVGMFCATALKEKGYQVAGALDKKRNEGELVPGVPIIRFSPEISVPYRKDDVIVLICLADGMLHKGVSEALYLDGYRYLVFLPLCHSMNQNRKRYLTDLYNKCLSASEALEQDIVIEDYAEYRFPELSRENAIVEETPEEYTILLNTELLFSESMDLWKGDKSKVFVQGKYKDKNIAAHYQTESIWDYFEQRAEGCEEYFRAFKQEKTEDEKKEIIKKREALYYAFQWEYNKGMEFFIHTAPPVVRNPKNYFNLVGGHHRTTFLLSKGHSLLPVRMKKEDFEQWYHRDAFAELEFFLRCRGILKTYAPVPHPAMTEFPSECERLGTTKLKSILKFLRWENLGEMSVLELGRSEGYFARNMLRCGARKAEYRSEKEENLLLAQKINKVLYIDKMQTVTGGITDDISEKYECIFVLDTFCNLAERKDRAHLLEKLNRMGTKFLVWESPVTGDGEFIRKETEFKDYFSLHKEFHDGQLWETGIYVKGKKND